MVSLLLFLPVSLLLLSTSSLPLTLGERLKLLETEQSQFESERKGEKVSLTRKAGLAVGSSQSGDATLRSDAVSSFAVSVAEARPARAARKWRGQVRAEARHKKPVGRAFDRAGRGPASSMAVRRSAEPGKPVRELKHGEGKKEGGRRGLGERSCKAPKVLLGGAL